MCYETGQRWTMKLLLSLQEGRLSKRAATMVLLLFGVGGALGGILGGVVGQMMWNWRPSSLPVFAGSSVWLGMPLLFWLVNAIYVTTPMLELCIVGLFAGLFASVAGAPLF
jgi:predicted MFS family arabinose efflux permease